MRVYDARRMDYTGKHIMFRLLDVEFIILAQDTGARRYDLHTFQVKGKGLDLRFSVFMLGDLAKDANKIKFQGLSCSREEG